MAKIKKTKQVLIEEQVKQNKYNFIKDEIKYCGEPTYRFNVGDKVSIGFLEDCVVEEVLHDGKLYYIDYTKIDYNYGNPIRREHEKGFWMWQNVRPINENKSHNIIKNRDFILNYMQQEIRDLFSKVYHFEVDFCPDYQRDFVWDEKDKEALIDSVFNNIDIGKFVFIDKGYCNDLLYEILDGKQRLSALKDFYENKFTYKGLYFNELSKKEQDYFESYYVSVAEVSDSSREQILKYFLMLNRQGRIMSQEQLKKVEKMLEDLK